MIEDKFIELKEKLIVTLGENLGIEKITFDEDELMSLTNEQAQELSIYFGSQFLIKLPLKEREFFDWVKEQDIDVWQDLWGDCEEPYFVSMSFLQDFLPKARGFPICDLQKLDNYYFSQHNITSENGSPFCDASLEAVKAGGKIRIDQAFIVEIWRAPIDIWRFSYMYNTPLFAVKEMVEWLLKEEIITKTIDSELESNTINKDNENFIEDDLFNNDGLESDEFNDIID
jgi:hypothetical protein